MVAAVAVAVVVVVAVGVVGGVAVGVGVGVKVVVAVGVGVVVEVGVGVGVGVVVEVGVGVEKRKGAKHMKNFLGKRITLFCMNYIYTGKLISSDDLDLELEDASIVYETGELGSKKWADAQALPRVWHVCRSAIESWGILK